MINYYEILGVPRTASVSEIESAWRRLAKKTHPDVNAGDRDAETLMKLINKARDELSDARKKSNYDAALDRDEGRTTGDAEARRRAKGDVSEHRRREQYEAYMRFAHYAQEQMRRKERARRQARARRRWDLENRPYRSNSGVSSSGTNASTDTQLVGALIVAIIVLCIVATAIVMLIRAYWEVILVSLMVVAVFLKAISSSNSDGR